MDREEAMEQKEWGPSRWGTWEQWQVQVQRPLPPAGVSADPAAAPRAEYRYPASLGQTAPSRSLMSQRKPCCP